MATMKAARPATIDDYIAAAPPLAQPHLRQLHAVLEAAAPHARQTIKWGTPFFVEPRFLFGFSAHKAHCSFAPPPAVLAEFRAALKAQNTTKNTIVIPYAQAFPEALIRQIAERSVAFVRARSDDAFW